MIAQSIETLADRPLPLIDADNRAFFEGCAAGELRLQRCVDTGQWQFYPRPMSIHTGGDVEWKAVAGRGTVHTFSIVRSNVAAPKFRPALPYVVAIIELDVGVRMLGNVIGCAPEDVAIGKSVIVEFHAADESGEIKLPFWRLAQENGAS